MHPAKIYYKCPRCGNTDADNVNDDTLQCDICQYQGKEKKFEAKAFIVSVQIDLRVIAHDEEDARQGVDILKDEYMGGMDYKILNVKEEK